MREEKKCGDVSAKEAARQCGVGTELGRMAEQGRKQRRPEHSDRRKNDVREQKRSTQSLPYGERVDDGNEITLGEIAVEEKSNAITAIPELLDLIDIEGGCGQH